MLEGRVRHSASPDGRFIFCYKSPADRKERLVGVLINKTLAGNVEVLSVNGRVADALIKLSKKQKLKIFLTYAPTSTNNGDKDYFTRMWN